MKRTIISVVAGLILLIVTYFLSNLIMNSGDEIVAKALTAEENVKVTNVKNSTNDATLSLNSIVQSENKLQLISEVTGIIDFTNIRFKKGQKFMKGQTIIKINSGGFFISDIPPSDRCNFSLSLPNFIISFFVKPKFSFES